MIKGKKINYIDFHTHILPNVDDGARSITQSLLTLKEEQEQGVETVVLTPHYFPDKDNLEEFLNRVNKSYYELKEEVLKEKIDINIILGAEVRISMELLEMDLAPLCIGETNYILIEFSLGHYHSWTKYVLSGIGSRGYIPIIAHAERYLHLPDDEIEEFIKLGAIIQVNIGSLFEDKQTKKIIKKLIRNNQIHIWGTDTHANDSRPVNIKKGLEYLEKKAL